MVCFRETVGFRNYLCETKVYWVIAFCSPCVKPLMVVVGYIDSFLDANWKVFTIFQLGKKNNIYELLVSSFYSKIGLNVIVCCG